MTSPNNTQDQYDLPLTAERFLPVFQGEIVAEHFHRYLVARNFVAGKAVLDIACGEGYGSNLLAERAASVIGVDISHDAVAHALKNYQRPNLQYRQGDCAAIPLPDAAVDVIISFETIEHHAKHQEMMGEIRRVLRPGGLLIISSPDKRYYSDLPGYSNPYHIRELYRDEFEDLLRQHFARHQILEQSMVYASALIGAHAGYRSYELDCPDGVAQLPRAMYLIAFASDGELPECGSSLMLHDLLSSSQVQERDAQIESLQAQSEEQHERAARAQAELAGELAAAQEKIFHTEQALRSRTRELAALAHRRYHPRWVLRQLLALGKRLAQRNAQLGSARQRVQASGYFDADWYLQQNPDVRASGVDPLEHYLKDGAFEGRDPSAHFDSARWLQQRPGLIERHHNPLLDFLDTNPPPAPKAAQPQASGGASADASGVYKQLLAAATGDSEQYVEPSQYELQEPARIRAIAFYLPQFHPFQENDQWWGRGFTEWTNVSKAVAQFAGHYQPHLPGELGFYDLRLPEVQERQVELAKQYGLAGFCFHYYWFSGGKRLLQRPLEQYLANERIDFPFCICWANENWTRRWDGMEHEILMQQEHLPQDDLDFIQEVAPLFADARYIRVDGKPLLIVYRVSLLTDAQRTAAAWRRYCLEHGIGEIYLVAAQSFGIDDPRAFGFDAAVQFPPHRLENLPNHREAQELANPAYKGKVNLYSEAIEADLARQPKDYLLYRCIFPSWDNEARKPGKGHVFHGASPALFRRWLQAACDITDARANPQEKLLFLNSWNEWAEGAHLEPDRRFGYANLRVCQEVLAGYPSGALADASRAEEALRGLRRGHAGALVLHLYYPDLWPELRARLLALQDQLDLIITYDQAKDPALYAPVLADFPAAQLVPCPNRGRDIAPFLLVLPHLLRLGYEYVGKLHAKKTLHRQDGAAWRRTMLDQLLGADGAACAGVRASFAADPELGMIGPDGHWLLYSSYSGMSDMARMGRLAARLDLPAPDFTRLGFFAGSMFWCRPQALAALADKLAVGDFEYELGQKDGTLAHALERIFAHAVQAAGMRVAASSDHQSAPKAVASYPYAAASEQMIQSHSFVTQGRS